MAKKKYYAVAVGRTPGIYDKWWGVDGAEAQVKGFPNAVFKGFFSLRDAGGFLKNHVSHGGSNSGFRGSKTPPPPVDTPSGPPPLEKPGAPPPVVIYTDGGCIRNPGPGGYGVVFMDGSKRKELSGGFRHTTNNRMELLACITGLRQLKHPSGVVLYSDSRYVVNGITKGWAKKWRSNNWMRTGEAPAINPDLWGQLLDLCDVHRVRFVWVKGHAGHLENERCDRLATRAAKRPNLPPDRGYERSK